MREESLVGDEDRALVGEEEALLAKVHEALIHADSTRVSMENLHVRLRELRDQAARASEGDLPALLDQLHSHQVLARQMKSPKPPDKNSPYFARMRLFENGRTRDVLLGHRTFIDPARGITIIDWRHAPVSRIFYAYREGEDYEEEFPGGIYKGVLAVRRVLTIQNGRLLRISTPARCFALDENSRWVEDQPDQAPRLAGGQGTATRPRPLGTGQTRRTLPEVSALLDREQFELLDAPDDTPLLILGNAGSGKTTVALHRLAALSYRDPGRYRPARMMVVAPETGLVRLSSRLLEDLGIEGVRVTTFDGWVSHQARMLLRSLPRRICEIVPPRVTRFKRHPALLSVLSEYLDRLTAETAERLKKNLPDHPEVAARFLKARNKNLLDRLEDAFKPLLSARVNPILDRDGDRKRKEITAVFDDETERIYDVSIDRVELFSDKELLDLAASRSKGELTPGMVQEVLDHSRLQFAERAEERFADYSPDRLATLDGRSLDDGTPEEAAGSIDVEDYAVLFELLRRKVGKIKTPNGALHTYAHIVIDEAQDLAPAELLLLGRAMRKTTSVTIAGDAAQQVDPSVIFGTWEGTLDTLGVHRAQSSYLKTVYRSTQPIAEFAHALLGPAAPAEKPVVVRDGVPVERSFFADEGHASVFMTEALTNLFEREPRASVAVIAKNAVGARRIFAGLSRLPRTRLVLDGEFDFRPGIDVTCVQQVKGLEFDYVVIPDADAVAYRDSPENRRMLHVAATRAIHQLWVISVKTPTPILP